METNQSYLNDMIEDSVVWKGNYGELKVFTKNDIPGILYLDKPNSRYYQEYRTFILPDAELEGAETYKVEVKYKTAFNQEDVATKVEHIYFIGFTYKEIEENIFILGNVETFKVLRKFTSVYDAVKNIIKLKPTKKKKKIAAFIVCLLSIIVLALIGGLIYNTIVTTSKVEQQYQQIQELQQKVDDQGEVIKQYQSHEVEELVKKSKQLEQQVANKKK
jgi:hypothetical protein